MQFVSDSPGGRAIVVTWPPLAPCIHLLCAVVVVIPPGCGEIKSGLSQRCWTAVFACNVKLHIVLGPMCNHQSSLWTSWYFNIL